MLAIALAVMGAGCMPPDRSVAARNLEREIAAMPGIDSVTVGYSHDFENGAELRLDVDMPQADEQQIGAVVTRINDLKTDDFKGYRQYASFVVGQRLVLKRDAELHPDQMVADARLLRRLRGDAPAGWIEWSRYGARSRLEIRSVTRTMEPLVAALATLEDDSSSTVYVRSDDPPAAPTWEVDTPTSMRRKDFENLLASLTLRAYYVHIDHESVVGLDVYVAGKESAFGDLGAVIHTIGPTKERPLELVWQSAKDTDNLHPFRGSLKVPSCPPAEGSAAEQRLVDRLKPEAVELQRRMWKEFADC